MASSSKEMELAIKIAGKVESSFTSALGKAGSGITSLTKTLTAATTAAAAAVGAIAVAAVNVGKEFESAMSQVSATMLLDTSTEEGAAAYETLEAAARECGSTTAFSATEAAEALNYLALAGYDAEEAATALPTVLNLAGAGAMDLATASDMVTDAMSALQLEATEDNLNSFADQLAMTASQANTSVEQLGEGILTVGATAANLAGGTTELNTALGILADNGIKGSEGGTHLRNVILSLQSPTDDAAAALDSLGVSVYDAEGNMNSLQDIFGDLSTAMEGMTQAEKDDIISTIFNKTDLTSANALLANCTDRWDELSAAIEDSAGACEDMYNIQLDNLEGDIDILKSGLSDLGISIYQDLNGPLRSMTQLATDMVSELSEAYSEGGLEGMVGAVGGVLAEAVNTVAEYVPQIVSIAVDIISGFIQGIADNSGQLADVAAQTLSVFIEGLFTLIPQVLLAGIDIITEFAQSMTTQLPTLISTGTESITNFVSGIIQRLPTIITTALTLVQTLVSSLVSAAPQLISAAIQLIGNLVLGLISMLPSLVESGLQLIVGLAQGLLSNLPLILQMAVQIIVTLVQGIAQMLPTIIQYGIQLIISLIQGIIGNLGNIVEAAIQIVLALISGLISAIPTLIAAIPQLISAIVTAIFETDWLAVGADLVSSIGNGIIEGAKNIAGSVKNAITGWFGGGDDETTDVSTEGAAAVDSYVSGIESNASAASSAATSLTSSAFTDMDYSSVTAAGATGAEAYTTGLTDSLSSFTFDTSSIGLDSTDLTTSLTTTALDSGTAFTTSLDSTISAYTFDTSSIGVDTAALTETLTTAGTTGGEALTSSINDIMATSTVDTSALTVDTTGLESALTAAGSTGAEALSTGMTSSAAVVSAAATELATDINTALDSGWSTAESSASSAMSSLATKVKTGAQAAAAAVKSAFENLSITIPKPKIPVITTTYRTETYGDGGSVSIPSFSVHWNALGGIFDQATILNTGSGLQGVGEAGPEAVLPLDTLWTQMRSILTEILQQNSGEGIISALLQKLQDIGTGGGGGGQSFELAGAGGPNITYSPTYNLYGNATKEDAVEAEKLSQSEFAKLMKEWQKNNSRTKF